MDKQELKKEENYLENTLKLVNEKLSTLLSYSQNIDSMLDDSNNEYFEYLKANANKINEDDVIELTNMQLRLDDLQQDTIDINKTKNILNKQLNKPYFASINISDTDNKSCEKYYIGLHSLVDENKIFKVVDWRSPLASIFYDVEHGKCELRTNSSILNCYLDNKRQYGISLGKLNFYIDTNINIEDDILKEALAKNTTSQMKSIVQTIQKEQNSVIRGDEYKNLIVQGVAGSGKTAIALHRIAYILYKQKNKITSKNINFISPNNAFSSYISSVLPDLAEEDVEKLQLDNIARINLKKHLILEKKYEQIERLICSQNLDEYNYKTSFKYLCELLAFAKANYIDNFDIEDFDVRETTIQASKIKDLFFNKYKDRDLFTRLKWITDNIFDMYFYKVKSVDKTLKFKQFIFMKLYKTIKNKNCVKAYMNFLESKNMKLELVGDKVKNEDAYAILLLKMYIYGLDKFENIKFLVIDEMQDYSAIQMYILSNLFDCPITMLGDFNQTLSPVSSKKLLNEYSKIINGESEFIELNKTYRSTQEIVDFYNKVGQKTNVNYVNRSGKPVEFLKIDKKNEINTLIEKINYFKSKGLNSIAIITKTNKQALALEKEFEENNYSINLIDDNIDKYNNDTCIISIYNSKGLEFDAVIIYNVGSDYASEIDQNLLYIASTRALHMLTITSNENKFSKLLDGFCPKEN